MQKLILPHKHNHINQLENITIELSKTDNFDLISNTFKQLGDSTRVRIFWFLCHYEECVTNLAALLNMTSPAISHHLRVLKDCGLVTSSRIGKEVYYKAANTLQCQLMHQMIEQVMEITCPK